MSDAAPSHEKSLKILICAVEPSGDALGATLIDELKARVGNLELFGCGGALMREKGLISSLDITKLSVIGPVSALRALPTALKAADMLAAMAKEKSVDCAILIDGWSFARLAAKKIKTKAPGVKLIKYVAPQVWGSRPHRAKTLSELFDGVLTLFDFEPEYFEKWNVPSQFVGHSGFQAAANCAGRGAQFRAKYKIGDVQLLAVLPGSRKSEVRRLTPVFTKVLAQLRKVAPPFRIVIPLSPSVAEDVRAATRSWGEDIIFSNARERYEAYAAADIALAASGTATTELAICRTPMVVAYKVDALTAYWVRKVATIKYLSMVNIAADHEIIPEFIQENCKSSDIAAVLLRLMTDKHARSEQLDSFPEQLEKFGIGGPPAANVAAETVLKWIGEVPAGS